MPLAKFAWLVVERRDVLVDDLQADRGVGGRFRLDGEIGDPVVGCDEIVDHLGIGIGARHQRLEAAELLCPEERIDIVLDAEHRRRVDRLALEDAFDQLAALGHAEDLRQRPGRRVAFAAARRRAATG